MNLAELTIPTGLLCLNLRREHVAGVRERAAVLDYAARELRRFRAAGLPVFHLYVSEPRDQALEYGALPGLEPRANEPVFASALSPHDAEHIAARVDCLRVIGDAQLARATAASLEEAGVRCSVVADACFADTNTDFAEEGRRVHCARAADEGETIICLALRRQRREMCALPKPLPNCERFMR